jgi:predicted secreted protein
MGPKKLYSLETDRLTVRVGEPFGVAVKGSPGGYVWEITSDAEAVRACGREQQASSKLGGRAQEVYLFEVVQAGETHVSFSLRRPWETEPIETRRLTITSVE